MMVVGALKQAKKDIKRFNPHSPSLQTFTFRIYIHREDTLTHPRKDLGVSLNYNELIANVQRQVISFHFLPHRSLIHFNFRPPLIHCLDEKARKF